MPTSARLRLPVYLRAKFIWSDKIGYLPVGLDGGNLFFQLVNACYERSAMILTSNRGFGEWAEVFGDAVVATAAIVLPIEGNSYRLREHADLIPEHLRRRPIPDQLAPAEKKRGLGRPKKEALDQ
jgi:IstB-like ATP binding protein